MAGERGPSVRRVSDQGDEFCWAPESAAGQGTYLGPLGPCSCQHLHMGVGNRPPELRLPLPTVFTSRLVRFEEISLCLLATSGLAPVQHRASYCLLEGA